jgi:lysyl-tRNA synthetase class 2
MLISRGQGAIVFADIQDASGKFQAVFKSDVMSEEKFALFKEVVDGGDFIEVTGTLYLRPRKDSRPSSQLGLDNALKEPASALPDKYHGLQDEEERFRKRYLDLLTKEDLRELFHPQRKSSGMSASVRS